MSRALELAAEGRGLASPGALVGAVLVRDGAVIGEGRYTWDGRDHAESQALQQAGDGARGATLYVTMEPCSHHGRTPPCADSLIAAGISRVVVATPDPDPRVDGRGLEALRKAGIVVQVGLMEAEASGLNEAFLHRTRHRRPFGILKVAMTLDGKIATSTGESRWITSEESRERAHQLRHVADALVTGSGTILKDDPLMTDRSGKARRRPLLRAVIDRRGRIGSGARFLSEPDAIVYTQVPHTAGTTASGVSHEVVVGTTRLHDVVEDLYRRDVQTLMMECGPDLAIAAVRQGIVDKIVAFVAPIVIGGREVPVFGGEGAGSLADAIGLNSWTVESSGSDLMVTAYVHRNH
jgi:diaminohydroxyphosphoribosylaminopyrimidine deaminase/5-amino-6-(5-phosphoribosylamino)uracil reductase